MRPYSPYARNNNNDQSRPATRTSPRPYGVGRRRSPSLGSRPSSQLRSPAAHTIGSAGSAGPDLNSHQLPFPMETSPRHEHPPADSPTYEQADAGGVTRTEQPSAGPGQRPAFFAPFFTLVEDSETGEHHHPHVHYVFSDDEPELITNALLRELDSGSSSGSTGLAASLHGADRYGQGERIQQRTLLVDVGPDGASVQGFKSLSASWQLGGASIGTAPTFDNGALAASWTAADGSAGPAGEAALMLRLEGVQRQGLEADARGGFVAEGEAGQDAADQGAQQQQRPTADELYGLTRRTLGRPDTYGGGAGSGAGGGGGGGAADALAIMEALHQRFRREMDTLARLIENVPGPPGERLCIELGPDPDPGPDPGSISGPSPDVAAAAAETGRPADAYDNDNGNDNGDHDNDSNSNTAPRTGGDGAASDDDRGDEGDLYG